MHLIYRWKCPHCGLEQNARAEVVPPHGYIARQLVLCDCDEGGCDQYVVTQPELTITATTTYMVVEAQPPTNANQSLEDYGEEFRAERKQAQEFLVGTRRGLGLE